MKNVGHFAHRIDPNSANFAVGLMHINCIIHIVTLISYFLLPSAWISCWCMCQPKIKYLRVGFFNRNFTDLQRASTQFTLGINNDFKRYLAWGKHMKWIYWHFSHVYRTKHNLPLGVDCRAYGDIVVSSFFIKTNKNSQLSLWVFDLS